MDAEQKLNEYRRRRKQQEAVEKVKEYVTSPFQYLMDKITEDPPKNASISVAASPCEDDVSVIFGGLMNYFPFLDSLNGWVFLV